VLTADIRRELDPASLLGAAQAEAGLDDFGDRQFVEPLTVLVDAVVREAGLSDLGVIGWKATVQSSLVNRLRMVRDLRDHPEILDEDVSDPIVILGLPRTGSTKLHRMMAAHPGVQRLPLWRLLNPAPLPGWVRGSTEPDARMAVAKMYEELMWQTAPDVMAGHPMAADQVDEETLLMETNFELSVLGMRLHVPSYLEWLACRSPGPTYEHLRTQLRYLQWQDGGARGRRWLLKSPLHLGRLDTLVEHFPGAILVQTHRHPATVIPSMARLNESYRRTQCDVVDLDDIGATQVAIWAPALSRTLEQRRTLGLDVIDVQFSEIVQGPFDVIGEAFGRAGLEVGEPDSAPMLAAAASPRQGSGTHEYSLGRYGLTDAGIRSAFGAYIDAFIKEA
jgi:hypothetical protein